MNKRAFWIVCICIIIILLGIIVGKMIYDSSSNVVNEEVQNNTILINASENEISQDENTIETTNQEEKTTPNTQMVYKTYYTKCNHYINEYKDIDISAVNLTESEIKEKNREWSIEEFSAEQVVLEKEEEEFCNQHYKLKLVDDNIVIFSIDENGDEKEYETTGITSEYLTEEDILKLKEGITVYGKENLSSVLEDYE